MLLAPFFLKGALALKALLLFNTASDPSHSRHVNRGLAGAAGAYVLGIAAVEYWHSNTVQPPGPDTSLVDIRFSMDTAPPILLLDAAPQVLLLDAAPVTILEVPILDFSVPETPTLLAPKALVAPEFPPDVVVYDLYFNILVFAPPDSAFWDSLVEKPFVPFTPTDDPPPIWRYEVADLTFMTLCLTKGMLPAAFGYYQALIIFSFRGFAALWYIWSVCSWFVDYPGRLLDLWRLYRARRNPQADFPTVVVERLYDNGHWEWFDDEDDHDDEHLDEYDDDEEYAVDYDDDEEYVVDYDDEYLDEYEEEEDDNLDDLD